MATVTIEEAFRSAFTLDADVILRVTGVPDKAMLTVQHVEPEVVDSADRAADVSGDVTLSEGGNDALIITDGDVVAITAMEMLSITGDGDDIDIKIEFTGPQSDEADSLELMLTLTATSDQADLALPIAEGMVRVMATMAPDEEPDPAGTPYFTENFIPTGGAVAFTIDPASCTLLYPYVTYNPPAMVDTGIAVTNPTGFGGDALSGPITFHLFGNDSDPESYTTDAGTPGGMDGGLDENGNLAAGKTYSVLLSQLLLWTNIEGAFEGHVYVETDFTRCSGLGLVWDNNGTFSQGYIPELISDDVTAGERGRTVDVPVPMN